MKADQTADLFSRALAGGSSVDFHVGTIEMWNDNTGSNRVRVLGTSLDNLNVLASAGVSSLEPGVAVLVGKYKTQYFILGRIVSQDLAAPQFPAILYPMFQPNTAIGASGYATVSNGVLTSWEGRVRIVHPAIELDGIWGIATGTGSITYAVKLGGTTVGSWTETSFQVGRRGPFDVSDYMGQDWLKIELSITASSGTAGNRAFQVLAAYFRQKPPV